MEFVFIRHGESEANVLAKNNGGFCCGRWDCDLTEKGKEQAKRLRGCADIKDADAVFCSPLKRSRQTAAGFTDNDVIIDDRITERTLGDFDGKWNYDLIRINEYKKYFNKDLKDTFRGSFTARTPNGESYVDVVNRVTSFIKEISGKNYKKVVVVSHVIAIRCMLKVIANLSEEETISLKIKQCEPIVMHLTEDAMEEKKIRSLTTLLLHTSGMRETNEFEIIMRDDKAEVCLYTVKYSQDGDVRIPEKIVICDMDTVIKLCGDCDIISWDGFDGQLPDDVLDGIDFTLKATVNGFRTIFAKGSENFPPHFIQSLNGLYEILRNG